MSAPSRRTVAAVLGALALALPGLPAVAASSTVAPAAAAAAGDGVIEPAAKGVVGVGANSAEPDVAGVLYDSRKSTPLAARETRTLDVLGGWVPASATGVILTVTAVDMKAGGWLTVWGTDTPRPEFSTLNFSPGTPVPNSAVVSLAAAHSLRVTNGSSGTTHVLLSFQGYVLDDGTEVRPGSLRPTAGIRVVDTRTTASPIPANSFRDVMLVGHGVPAGATAAAVNVVAVKPTRAGYLIAHSPATPRPTTTNLTYSVGSDRAGLSVVPISSTGEVRLWNMSSAPVHVVLDTFGWVAGGGDASATLAGLDIGAPTRILDTRTTPEGAMVSGKPRAVPGPSRGSGMLLSVTVTGATRAGFLRYGVNGPDFRTSPSFLNFAAGQTVTTSVIVPLYWRNKQSVLFDAVTSGSVHVIVDRIGVVGERAEVSGKVVDAVSGAPVSGATISTVLFSGTDAKSGADGVYRANPGSPKAVSVCARTLDSRALLDRRYITGCARGVVGNFPVTVGVPLGARLVGEDVALAPGGTLGGTILGPEGNPDVYGYLTIQPVNRQASDLTVPFGRSSGSQDGTWQAPLLPGTYIVSVLVAYRQGTSSPSLAKEVSSGLPLFLVGTQPPDTVSRLLAAGARTFTVTSGSAGVVPTMTMQVPGTITPTVVDPDGDLSDVQLDFVHTDSGFRVWRYPVGSTIFELGRAAALRPGAYAVCATEGATTVCNDRSSSAATATPIQVVSGQTEKVTLTLP
jgi:hypothetical protein